MKLDLPVPLINVIVQALQTLQQQAGVALEEIDKQVRPQMTPPAPAGGGDGQPDP